MNIQIPSLLAFALIIHHCCNGILLEHPDRLDFKPFEKSRHYAEKDKQVDVSENQRCQCGREMVNEMALVYFERGLSEDHYLSERFLVSAKKLASGGYSKVRRGLG